MKPKKRKWKKIGRKVSFLVAGMFAISIVALVALCVSMFYKLTMNMMQDQCVNGTNVLAYQLDNYTGPEDKTQLLDDLKELVGCEFTIFDGDVRTYTTIQQDGKRVVGTTLSADLAKTVLEEGQTYVGKAEILGVTHLCSYVPTKDASGKINGLIVLDVAHSVGRYMTDYLVVVTKSTVPVGTARKVKAAIQSELDKRGEKIDFDVASNPEFLKEGNAIADFMRPDRVVVGVESERAEALMQKLYKPFMINKYRIIITDIPSAEMIKYAANAMLATRISFMNEIALLCDEVGADVGAVRKGIGADDRIGSRFLYAGCGYGGSCFPKDVKALIKTAEENDCDMQILKAVERVNESQKELLYHRLLRYFDGKISGRKFAVWGLSFKPETDDMREAPALILIDKLCDAGARVKVYDPVAMPECKRRIGNKVEYAENIYEAVADVDALLIVTEWKEFRLPDWKTVIRSMKSPVIFDGRNIYDPSEMRELGFAYYSIGRPTV